MNRDYYSRRTGTRPTWVRRLAVMLAWFAALALLGYFWSWGLLGYTAFLFRPLWGN